VGILLLPQFSNLGLALVIEPLAIANWLAGTSIYEWVLLSVDGQPVRATNGMLTSTDSIRNERQKLSTIFVIASFEAKLHSKDRRIRTWLQRESIFGAQIAGIETGTELLAAAALLDGHHAAVHWDNFEGFQEAYPRVRATTKFYTIEPRLMTCAGATAVADMMSAWIAHDHGSVFAEEISQHLLQPRLRGCGEDQTAVTEVGVADGAVAEAIRLMQKSINSPLSCQSIAANVGLSRRQLERQFRHHMSIAPLKYYINLRVSTAHKLLQQTDLSVSQVAVATGFDTLEHFSRIYKSKFGRPPSQDRSQSLDAPVMRRFVRPPAESAPSGYRRKALSL
jgi:AraC family carnitine catabolism transcriptional activator